VPALRMAAQCKTPGAMVHVYGAPPRWRKNPDEAANMVVAHNDAESAIVMKMNRAKVWSFQTCVLQAHLNSCGQCTLRAAANLCQHVGCALHWRSADQSCPACRSRSTRRLRKYRDAVKR